MAATNTWIPAWALLAWTALGASLMVACPAVADPGADPASESLFVANCSACHQRDGQGIPQAFPTLVGSRVVQGEPGDLVALLLKGRGGMPAFRTQLDDAQIAAVASYVRGAWGNAAGPVPPLFVAEARTGADAQAAPPDRLQAH